MREKLQKLVDEWPTEIPFERAVKRRRLCLAELLSLGATWAMIARALTVAGVRKRTGAPMTAKQMNTVYLRVSRSQPRQGRSRESGDNTIAVRSREISGNEKPTSPSKSVSAPTQDGICTHTPFKPTPTERLSEAARLQKSKKFDFDD